MAGTAVTQQSTVSLRRANQILEKGDEDAAEEVLLEEAVTKDMTEEAGPSTTHNTHHRSETLREKWRILAQF